MSSPASDQLERFRDLVARHLGLQFEDTRLGFLTEVLERRLEHTGRSCDSYLTAYAAGFAPAEISALVEALTVCETYFFRNIDQFRVLVEVAAPLRLRQLAGPGRLRILSAGCASGEEAYTIAMLMRQLSPFEASIRAVDIHSAMLERAKRGRYSDWALRETPADMRQRWFRRQGSDMVLDEEIRAAVHFENRNLAEDDPNLWQPAQYDAVFCRNVLMYFTPEQARALVARIARALVPGGYLFLGHAETLRGLSQDFHLLHTHATFYYQRKEDAERATAAPDAVAARAPRLRGRTIEVAAQSDAVAGSDSIRRAAERVQCLDPLTPLPPGAQCWDAGVALELMHQERFAEALHAVRAAPPQRATDVDVLLLKATLLAHTGELAEAQHMCRELLEQDELNAGAHYVLALCRDSAGDPDGAVQHDQVASYLDASFAMPRLHVGLLARRRGDRETARRELGRAFILLQREETSRLLLFGGGFNRDTLITLCRTELQACGATP